MTICGGSVPLILVSDAFKDSLAHILDKYYTCSIAASILGKLPSYNVCIDEVHRDIHIPGTALDQHFGLEVSTAPPISLRHPSVGPCTPCSYSLLSPS